jgi:hypothetical protein
MKSVLLAVVAIALAGSVTGCGIIFGPDQSVILAVETIDAPTTVGPAASFTAVLTVVTGGCRQFDRIEVRRNASSATVTAWGTDGSIGRDDIVCPADFRTELHSVRFEPPFAGTFNISVNRGRLAPLQTTVQVQ